MSGGAIEEESMHKRYIAVPVALVTAVAFTAGVVRAEEDGDEVADDETELCEPDGGDKPEPEPESDDQGDDVPEPDGGLEPLMQVRLAAQEASDAVQDLEDDECSDDREDAKEALQAVVDRWESEGKPGNGVALKVLEALIAGESPAGIGADHGEEMAAAAADRREQRKADKESNGHGPPDHAGPKSGDDKDEDDKDEDDKDEDNEIEPEEDDVESEDEEDVSDDDGGRPDDAGPKDDNKRYGPPAHAGPKKNDG